MQYIDPGRVRDFRGPVRIPAGVRAEVLLVPVPGRLGHFVLQGTNRRLFREDEEEVAAAHDEERLECRIGNNQIRAYYSVYRVLLLERGWLSRD